MKLANEREIDLEISVKYSDFMCRFDRKINFR